MKHATSLHFHVRNISRTTQRKVTQAAAYRSGSRLRGGMPRKQRLRQNISVVGRAAYRSGDPLYDRKAGKIYDFSRKEDVRFTEIVTPDHARDDLRDRESLWNIIEEVEIRKDAQLAKDFSAALPRSLSLEQQIAIVREFCKEEFISRGLIADLCVHNKKASDGLDNPHAHILVTTRPILTGGTFGKKDRSLDKKATLYGWRERFEAICNRHLETAGSTQRVSLQSFKTRGIDRTPTVHLGHAAWRLESGGIETVPGDHNRAARHHNGLRDLLNIQGLDVEPMPEPVVGAEPQERAYLAVDKIGGAEMDATLDRDGGLKELAKPADDGAYGETESHHRRYVAMLARNIASPVVQARMSVLRQMQRIRSWWLDRFQNRQAEPERSESVFDRYNDENLSDLARRQRKEPEHER